MTSITSITNTNDIFTEILMLLPTRSLARCKCVSKRWRSFISAPEFCRRHFLRNGRPSAIVPSNKSKGIAFPFIPLDDLHQGQGRISVKITNNRRINDPFRLGRECDHKKITISQSCNGLWLLHARVKNPIYYVFNPTTNQFARFYPAHGILCSFTTMALAFDPSKSPHYKLLHIWTPRGDTLKYLMIQVYSSKSRTWKLLDSRYKLQSQISYDECVYWNGALHWAGTHDRRLTYYHVDDERLRHVDRPLYNDLEPCTCRSLQESYCGGHLSLIESYASRVKVLEMRSDYYGWCFKYNVNLIGPMFRDFAVLFVKFSGEDEGDDELVLHVPGKIVSCDMKSNEFKSFWLRRMRFVDDSCLRVEQSNFKYVESLVVV